MYMKPCTCANSQINRFIGIRIMPRAVIIFYHGGELDSYRGSQINS
jgi:hypothetical protein